MRKHGKWQPGPVRLLLAAALAAALLFAGFPRCNRAMAGTPWPSGCDIASDAGVVMDAATGTVLYEKNMHGTYPPASITKVLTALIVLEKCDLGEEVTFSRNAVRNVEDDSTSAGYEPGDTASVETLLYALLLKSANETANALAEHVSGSTEAFAGLMNETASALGCQDSHFANPSGLNDPDHYVSAYDMALILREAIQNPVFVQIISTPYYQLPANSRYPDGLAISPGNKMVKSNWPQYRSDCIGGKTGYTQAARNTLVNAAREGDFTVVTAVLHSSNTQYEDTSRMMDFAFQNFTSVLAVDTETAVSRLADDLTIGGYRGSAGLVPVVDSESRLVLPKNAPADSLTVSVEMAAPGAADDAAGTSDSTAGISNSTAGTSDGTAGTPDGAAGKLTYALDGRTVGTAWLSFARQSPFGEADPGGDQAVHSALSGGTSKKESAAQAGIPSVRELVGRIPRRVLWIAAGCIFLVLVLNLLLSIRRAGKAREEMEAEIRRRKREKRLRESGMTREELERMKRQIREGAARRKEGGSAEFPKKAGKTAGSPKNAGKAAGKPPEGGPADRQE
jgi:D-alanyl-D-alanine carboxypeptidase (penicillin-binding protein 5/6)